MTSAMLAKLFRRRLVLAGAIVLATIAWLALFAPWLTPYDPMALKVLAALRVFALAESLGAVESLAEHPGRMTHASIPAEERERIGVRGGLIRLSIGVEDADDLVADLEDALAAAHA